MDGKILRENDLLTIYIPAANKALLFRIKSTNKYTTMNYGALPFSSGDTLPTYDGGSASVPADGVMPARAYTETGISFPMSGAYDETDMWFLPSKEYRDRLFHVHMFVTPAWLRVDVQIPKGVWQSRFQRDKIITGIEKDFGFNRGYIEVIHLPGIHYGYRFGNDTNMPVYTFVKFIYGEYVVEIPRDVDLIFNVLTRRVTSYWYTMPVQVYDSSIAESLPKAYGIDGFPLYGIHEEAKAKSEYKRILEGVKL